jgi:hypothetical protein
MKRKGEVSPPADFDEQRAVEELKTQLEQLGEHPDAVPQTYWPSLLVRTNWRIDDATSAKALSISWAARVAIPGVVAILFFFIGLHYYVPEMVKKESSVASLINMLPEETVDSILVEPERLSTSLSAREVSSDIFQFSADQITEYLVATGNAQTTVDNMSDADIAALLSALDAKKNL